MVTGSITATSPCVALASPYPETSKAQPLASHHYNPLHTLLPRHLAAEGSSLPTSSLGMGGGGGGQGECSSTWAEKTPTAAERTRAPAPAQKGSREGPLTTGAPKPGSLSMPGTDRIQARCGRNAQAGAALLRAPRGVTSRATAEILMGPWRGTCAATLAWVCAR